MLASSSGGVGGRLVGSALHNSSNAFVTMETGVFKATIDANRCHQDMFGD